MSQIISCLPGMTGTLLKRFTCLLFLAFLRNPFPENIRHLVIYYSYSSSSRCQSGFTFNRYLSQTYEIAADTGSKMQKLKYSPTYSLPDSFQFCLLHLEICFWLTNLYFFSIVRRNIPANVMQNAQVWQSLYSHWFHFILNKLQLLQHAQFLNIYIYTTQHFNVKISVLGKHTNYVTTEFLKLIILFISPFCVLGVMFMKIHDIYTIITLFSGI